MVAQFQRDSYGNGSDDENITRCQWAKELLIKSTDHDLIKRMEDKYDALDGLEQWGITYLNIDLDEMFNMSDVVINLLQEFFKNFSQDSVSNYPSENVALLVQQINDVAEQLAEVLALPRDTSLLILTGFTKCSVNNFLVHAN